MKVLIYMEQSQLRPVGGPWGYHFNLYREITANNDCEIEYLKIDKGYQKLKKSTNIDNWKFFKGFGKSLKLFVKHFFLEYGSKHQAIVDLNEYDMVHFHSTLDMYQVRDSLKNYKGKVILTSHSPTLLSKEVYDKLNSFEKTFLSFVYNKLIKFDEYAFDRADYFIFPCEEAEEPYYHCWDKFKEIKEKKKNKFFYVPTGINPCTAKIERNEVRDKYCIPNDAFLLCYVGRHNEIKGYDILKRICAKLLKQFPNLYVIVAGAETPIKRLEHDRWIEVGWTNDPHSIISASDIFVLPNRETYFDLILLEVMSLGKIIVASNTGGNKYFANENGVILYSDEDDAVSRITELVETDWAIRQSLEIQQKSLFEKSFVCSVFYSNYKNVYRLIHSL